MYRLPLYRLPRSLRCRSQREKSIKGVFRPRTALQDCPHHGSVGCRSTPLTRSVRCSSSLCACMQAMHSHQSNNYNRFRSHGARAVARWNVSRMDAECPKGHAASPSPRTWEAAMQAQTAIMQARVSRALAEGLKRTDRVNGCASVLPPSLLLSRGGVRCRRRKGKGITATRTKGDWLPLLCELYQGSAHSVGNSDPAPGLYCFHTVYRGL